MIRLSVGLEDIEDIVWDLDHGPGRVTAMNTALSCPLPSADGVAANSPVNRGRFATTAYQRLRILERYKHVAMVGSSSNPFRPSHFAAIYLRQRGTTSSP